MCIAKKANTNNKDEFERKNTKIFAFFITLRT